MSKKSLSKAASLLPGLTVDEILDLTDERSFERGEAYLRAGAVRDIVSDHNCVVATVQGTESYRVELAITPNQLVFSCTCPVGYDGWFCKHCVAVALASIEGVPAGLTTESDAPIVSMEDLVGALLQLEKKELVALLAEQAMADESLRRKIQYHVDRRSGKQLDPTPYRRMIDKATKFHDFLDYHESRHYASQVREAIKTLSELVDDQMSAAAVIPLIERALPKVERQMLHADDSNGEIGGVLRTLEALHLRACLAARPDPIGLAERLFAMAVASEWEAFHNAYASYTEILGDSGRCRYRKLAESEWKKLKPARREFEHNRNRSTLLAIMETIATVEGDVDLLVKVKAKDLTHPYRYFLIAEILNVAGRSDEALDWAERGVSEFSGRPDSRLVRFLVEEYVRRGRKREALDAVWNLYVAAPGVEAFAMLKERAIALRAWKTWRPKAIGLLDERCKHFAAEPRKILSPLVNSSTLLVEILLSDGDDDAAWIAATGYGCRQEIWLRLAAARAGRNPEDALAVYRSHIQRATEQASRSAYEQIVELLSLMEPILRREERADEFIAEVETLRETWKRRPSFVGMLGGRFLRRKQTARAGR